MFNCGDKLRDFISAPVGGTYPVVSRSLVNGELSRNWSFAHTEQATLRDSEFPVSAADEPHRARTTRCDRGGNATGQGLDFTGAKIPPDFPSN